MRLTLAERNRQLSSAIATCNTVFETTERQRRAAVRNLSTSLHELLPLGARVRVSIDGRPSGAITGDVAGLSASTVVIEPKRGESLYVSVAKWRPIPPIKVLSVSKAWKQKESSDENR